MKLFLMMLLAVLQVADALTTLKILAKGGRELNPVMDWLFKRMDATTALFLVKSLIIAIFWIWLDQVPVWAFAVVCGLTAAVVYHNITEIRR